VLVSDVQTRNALIEESRVNEQRDLAYVRDWKYERFMESALTAYPLRKAKIRGIGASRIESLEAIGIRTAADINPANEGLALRALEEVANNTPAKAIQEWTRLESWRRSREKALNFQLPPDDPDINGIIREYTAYRQQLEAEITAIQARVMELDQLRKGLPGSEIDALKASIVAAQKTLDEANGRVSQAEQEVQRYMLITPRNLTDKILKG
jgi:DNA-binding helix-hairpin-helix protein with protein kinase domain